MREAVNWSPQAQWSTSAKRSVGATKSTAMMVRNTRTCEYLTAISLSGTHLICRWQNARLGLCTKSDTATVRRSDGYLASWLSSCSVPVSADTGTGAFLQHESATVLPDEPQMHTARLVSPSLHRADAVTAHDVPHVAQSHGMLPSRHASGCKAAFKRNVLLAPGC